MLHAVLDSHSLKTFTKFLLCLSKYGDDLTLHASPDALDLSATNSSKSAYCRFRLVKTFFSRYNFDVAQNDGSNGSFVAEDVVGQVLTKSVLSVLKHKSLDKSVERCELYIYDGVLAAETNDVESKFVVRLHCKHGVVKTHRLLLMSHCTLLAPATSDRWGECRVIIGSKMLKEMLEHFPPARAKSDPRLVWTFGETEVGVKSLETGIDDKGKAQISTELTVNANEFDDYIIHVPPITIAFHLREFSATIAFADSMNLSLALRFTDSASPLYIDIDGENDSAETLFVISTSQVHGAPARTSHHENQTTGSSKRDREERTITPAPSKKLVRAVQPVDRFPNGSDHPIRLSPVSPGNQAQTAIGSRGPDNHEPLFLPMSPQAADGEYEGNIPVRNIVSKSKDAQNRTLGGELSATQNGDERIDFYPLFED